MKTQFSLARSAGIIVGAAALFSVSAAAATFEYDISVDTSSLIANPSAPFSLDFQLNDGDSTGNGNNTAILSGFTFGGGSASGGASVFGGATGTLASQISITDTAAFNELYEAFTAGSLLTFHLSVTHNANSGETPDSFSFAVLDKDLANIPTTGLANTLVSIDLTPGTPTVLTGASGPVTVTVTPVPEPADAAIVGTILAGLFACWRARK
ncbi:MAG TPA: NF038129 family PEP-CTERM protein [Candidatus Limnocylindria bacterium]|jgi:hypothetical protein|nr:NF038129 family PEP-CTERM protein [Candidatus Limnocylindria bacterium]